MLRELTAMNWRPTCCGFRTYFLPRSAGVSMVSRTFEYVKVTAYAMAGRKTGRTANILRGEMTSTGKWLHGVRSCRLKRM